MQVILSVLLLLVMMLPFPAYSAEQGGRPDHNNSHRNTLIVLEKIAEKGRFFIDQYLAPELSGSNQDNFRANKARTAKLDMRFGIKGYDLNTRSGEFSNEGVQYTVRDNLIRSISFKTAEGFRASAKDSALIIVTDNGCRLSFALTGFNLDPAAGKGKNTLSPGNPVAIRVDDASLSADLTKVVQLRADPGGLNFFLDKVFQSYITNTENSSAFTFVRTLIKDTDSILKFAVR
jgi:hypothetical protein